MEVELPRDLGSAAAAREAIGELGDQLPEDLLGDVRLLVSELVTNALRHADLDPEESIGLRVDVTHLNVRVEVLDPGKGFEPGEVPEDPDRAEGWGLYLVATLSDRWGVDRGPMTRVWFEFDRAQLSDAA